MEGDDERVAMRISLSFGQLVYSQETDFVGSRSAALDPLRPEAGLGFAGGAFHTEGMLLDRRGCTWISRVQLFHRLLDYLEISCEVWPSDHTNALVCQFAL